MAAEDKCKPTWLPYGLRLGGCLELDPGIILPNFEPVIVEVYDGVYEMTGEEDVILCTGFVEIIMISVAEAKRTFTVNADGDSVIMTPQDSDTIETPVIVDGNSANFAPKKSTSAWLNLYNPNNEGLSNGFIGIGTVGSGELYTRDGFFSYKDNKSILKYGLPITVNINDVMYDYVWNDPVEPVFDYDITKWKEASTAVPSGTVSIGSIDVKEAGDHGFIYSNLSSRGAFTIDRELDPETGSLDPFTEKLSEILTILTIDAEGIDIPIDNGIQFSGSSPDDIDAYQSMLKIKVKTDLVNFYLVGRWDSQNGTISVVSETINHSLVDPDGDLVEIPFKNLTKIDANKTYYTTLYMDEPAILVGGIIDGEAPFLHRSEAEAQPYQVIVGANVLERQNLLSGSTDTPDAIRDKLETLEGDERLNYSAIKNNNALTTHYTSEDLTVPANWNGDILTVIDATGDITVTLPSVDLLLNAWSLLIVNTATTQTYKITVLAGDGTYIINDDDCLIPSQASMKLGYDAVYNTIYPIHFDGFPKYITVNAGGGNLNTSWSIEGYIDFDANYSQIYAVKMSFTLSAVVADITTEVRIVGTGIYSDTMFFAGSKTSNSNGYHEIDLVKRVALPDEFMTFELQAKRSPVWGQSSVGKITIIYGDKP